MTYEEAIAIAAVHPCNEATYIEAIAVLVRAARGMVAMEKMLCESGLEKPWELCVDIGKDGDQFTCSLHRVTEFSTSLISWERAPDLATAAEEAAGKLEGM
jgi:hypothetical protein